MNGVKIKFLSVNDKIRIISPSTETICCKIGGGAKCAFWNNKCEIFWRKINKNRDRLQECIASEIKPVKLDISNCTNCDGVYNNVTFGYPSTHHRDCIFMPHGVGKYKTLDYHHFRSKKGAPKITPPKWCPLKEAP